MKTIVDKISQSTSTEILNLSEEEFALVVLLLGPFRPAEESDSRRLLPQSQWEVLDRFFRLNCFGRGTDSVIHAFCLRLYEVWGHQPHEGFTQKDIRKYPKIAHLKRREWHAAVPRPVESAAARQRHCMFRSAYLQR